MWLSLFILMITGYTTVSSQSSVGNCTRDTCKNGAVCEDTVTGYQCYCVDGYAGPNCEINFDDCMSDPCFNNATCADDVAAYSCLCLPGFTGGKCQINIDECISDPCLRNGKCIDLINGFICECPMPYKGDNCSLLPCETSPCENDGVCYNDIQFSNTTRGYFCECVKGFEGWNCEINIDDCNATACSGQGICIDGVDEYSCFCEPGFVGEDCQFPVNDCIGNECRNNATCHDIHLGYWCECTLPGYEGILCERERDECSDWEPCQNGGTCVDMFNGYSCHCTEDWTGKNCTDEVNRCLNRNPCLNYAGCVDLDDGFFCQCRPFYTGKLCETAFNPCAPEYSPCQNEAECISPPDGQYRCFCKTGFTGEHCEVNVNECLLFPCKNNATCEDLTAGYVCHCMSGWTGPTCAINIDDCENNSCLNGALCVDLVNRFECNCTDHYTGHFCESLIDYCYSDPCYYGGSCRLIPGGHQCDCLPPHTGAQCRDLINSCENEPCYNNGSCVSLSPGYVCNCVDPFTGTNCEDFISYCASGPCMNDGLCRENINDFLCICPPLLTGKQCTDLIDYCKDNPCKNDGICVNGQFTYRCVCTYGFKGINCTDMLDFCLASPCQNSGNCSNIPGGYICDCPSQFYGKLCESVLISSVLTSSILSTHSYQQFSFSSTENIIAFSFLSLYMSLESSVNTANSLSVSDRRLSSHIETVSLEELTKTGLSIEQTAKLTTKNSPFSFSTFFEDLSYTETPSPEEFTKTGLSFEQTAKLTTKNTPFSFSTSFEERSYTETPSPKEFTKTGLSFEQTTKLATKDTLSPFSTTFEELSPLTSHMLSITSLKTIKNTQSSAFQSVVANMSTYYTTAFTTEQIPKKEINTTKVLSHDFFSKGFSLLKSSGWSWSTGYLILTTSVSKLFVDSYSALGTAMLSRSESSFFAFIPTLSTTTTVANLSSTATALMSSTLASVVTPMSVANLISTVFVLESSPVTETVSKSDSYSTVYLSGETRALSIPSTSARLKDNTNPTSATESVTTQMDLSIIATGFDSDNVSKLTEIVISSDSFPMAVISEPGITVFQSKSGFSLSDFSHVLVMSSIFQPSSNTIVTHTSVAGISSAVASISSTTVAEKFTETVSSIKTLEHSQSKTNSTYIDIASSLESTRHPIVTTDLSHMESDVFTSVSVLSKDDSTFLVSSKLIASDFQKTSADMSSLIMLTISEKGISEVKISNLRSVLSQSVTSDSSKTGFSIFSQSSRSANHSFVEVSKTSSLYSSTSFNMHFSLSEHSSVHDENVTSNSSYKKYSGDLSLYSSFSYQKSYLPWNTTNQFVITTDQILNKQHSYTKSYLQSFRTGLKYTTPSGLSSSAQTTTVHRPSLVKAESTSYNIEPTPSYQTDYPSSLTDYTSNLSTSFVSHNIQSISVSQTTESLSHVITKKQDNTYHTLSFTSATADVATSTNKSPYGSISYMTAYDTHVISSGTYVSSEKLSESPLRSEDASVTSSTTTSDVFNLSSMSHFYTTMVSSLKFIKSELLESFSKSVSRVSSNAESSSSVDFPKTTTTRVVSTTEFPKTACDFIDCYNGGVCELRGSAVCVCRQRFTGSQCETAITMPMSFFDGKAYLETGSYDVTGSVSVRFSFNTSQASGILLYYQTETSSINSEIRLVVEEGVLQCYFLCDGQSFMLDTRQIVNNGRLFTITIRQSKPCEDTLQLIDDYLEEPPLTWKIETNQLAGKDHMTQITSFFIGGFPLRFAIENQENFTGCIGNIFVNEFPVWANDSLSKIELKDCRALVTPDVCEDIECLNGGKCRVILKPLSPKCDCLVPYTGVRCESEILLHYPSFDGTSFLKYPPTTFYRNQSNEIFISVRPLQADGIVLFSASQNTDFLQSSFIYLFLEDGVFQYRFSCDGVITGTVVTNTPVILGDTVELLIRQSWTSGAGQWCNAALILNSVAYVSQPILTLRASQLLGYLFIGGTPGNSTHTTTRSGEKTQGFIGCIKNLQVNDLEFDIISMATEGINIGNCDVSVCQDEPCENGGTCHSSGENWYCECVSGYTGRLCGSRVCASNVCLHGGTCVVLESESDYLCLCPYGRGGIICEQDVLITVPHFSGNNYGYTSFLAYENVDGMRNDFEVRFNLILDDNSITQNSLILFMGNAASRRSEDFMLLGFFKDYVVFRYNLGSGVGSVWSAAPVDYTIPHHNIQFGRRGKEGWLRLDYQQTVTGKSPGVLTALNSDSILYIGGADVSVSERLPSQIRLEHGLRGCIYDLEISSEGGDFIVPGSPPGRADYGRSVRQCTTLSCDDSPCQNEADCIDVGSSLYCNCTNIWKGLFCMERMTVCDIGHDCAEGAMCMPRAPSGYQCLCPLGRRGLLCDEEFDISDPDFLGENSYMCFTPVYVKQNIDIKLQIKPRVMDGVVFYVAKRLHSYSGDFLSLALQAGKIQLRYHLGDKLNVLANTFVMKTDGEIWYTVIAGRNSTHGYISVEGHVIVAMTTGRMTYLDTTTDFYLGGVSGFDLINPSAVPNEPSAFQGCIRELIVNDNNYQLTRQGAKDGRNIGDCDGTSCGYNVCSNGGTCTETSSPPSYFCTCTENYYGNMCEEPIECRDFKCENGGTCRQHVSGNYGCSCAIGWTGSLCQLAVQLGSSIALTRDSYIYYVDPNYRTTNDTYTNLSLAFRTSELDGLLLWNGQTYSDDEDYLGLGLQAGRIKMVWNLGWYSRSEVLTSSRYNDGQWHTVSIERNFQSLTMTVDGLQIENKVSGDFYTLDTHGAYFIGGFKEGNVITRSLGFYKDIFKGCVRNLYINDNIVVSFHKASEGRDVLPC